MTVDWPDSSPIVAIFLIDDYEDFYRDPLTNGTFKYVEKPLLERGWVDRVDMIFTWEKLNFKNGVEIERAQVGSGSEASGALLDLINTLKEYA